MLIFHINLLSEYCWQLTFCIISYLDNVCVSQNYDNSPMKYMNIIRLHTDNQWHRMERIFSMKYGINLNQIDNLTLFYYTQYDMKCVDFPPSINSISIQNVSDP